MNTRKFTPALRPHLVTLSAVSSLLLSSALLVACGGGGGVGGSGTGTSPGPGLAATTVTGFSAGAVSGKGSTIVNGVEFDDSSATVTGEDDSADLLDDKGSKLRSLTGDDVKLGMEVEIEHGDISCPSTTIPTPTVAACDVTPTATAARISFGNNSLVAPISSFTVVTAATATAQATYSFSLLGQPVQTTVSTEINLETPAVALADGVVVEVHGKFDVSTGVTTASRIEVKSATAAAFTGSLRLRGIVDLKATPPTIGGVAVLLIAAQQASVSDGQVVRAKLTAGASAPYPVESIKSAQRKLDDQKGHHAELEGVVDTSASASGVLTINGASVSVDPKVVNVSTLTSGAKVLVTGTVSPTGTLVASTVTVSNLVNTAPVTKEFLGYSIAPTDASGTNFVNTYNASEHTFQVWTTTKPYVLRETVVIIQANDSSGLPATVFAGKGGSKPTEAIIAGQKFSTSTASGFNLLDIFGYRRADGKLVATRIQVQPNKGV
jgi:hypothetical protein